MGREMNDVVNTHLGESVSRALSHHGVVDYALVTDLNDTAHTLVELVRNDIVVHVFLISPPHRPYLLRYRDKVDLGAVLPGGTP